MSKGPGRIERAITAAIEAEPDNAFTVEDLCDRAFPGANRIEKKHRVSVLRAMKKLVAERERLDFFRAETQGCTLVLFQRGNVMSYGMARLKACFLEGYRPTARKAGRWIKADEMANLPPAEQERRLRSRLLPGGEDHKMVVRGGHWWQHAHA
jgi:hypothetical protein